MPHLIMATKRASIIYTLWGMVWRLTLAGAVVFSLTAVASYALARRILTREDVQAPNLVTLSAAEALEKASSQGFSVVLEKREPSELLPEGHVLAQRPMPDMWVKEGATLRLTVAAKP